LPMSVAAEDAAETPVEANAAAPAA
jgi:hypothetical protein